MPQDQLVFNEVIKLQERVEGTVLPPELKERLTDELARLKTIANIGGNYLQEYSHLSDYIDWITTLPWDKKSEDILDLQNAQKVLDKNHFGLKNIKDQVLEYLSVIKLKKEKKEEDFRAPILCFVGLVGTGKTTIATSIAEAMGRKLIRIPFGGMGDPLYLRGQSRMYSDSEPGQVIKALKRAGTKNPVILLDEIDRVVDQFRATIMGVLIELLDPEQNKAFTDHFIDFPFDLSQVLFIATCNNTSNISIAVLDRLEPIQMPSYTDEEKIMIGKNFVLPKAIREAGLNDGALVIDDSVWPKVVRPLGYDAGIRTLERTIDGICRKTARMVVEKKGSKFVINDANIKEFLPTW